MHWPYFYLLWPTKQIQSFHVLVLQSIQVEDIKSPDLQDTSFLRHRGWAAISARWGFTSPLQQAALLCMHSIVSLSVTFDSETPPHLSSGFASAQPGLSEAHFRSGAIAEIFPQKVQMKRPGVKNRELGMRIIDLCYHFSKLLALILFQVFLLPLYDHENLFLPVLLGNQNILV